MTIRYPLLALCTILAFGMGSAQIFSFPELSQSPDVALMTEYGDTKVSYFTGQPVIEIPLYDIPIAGRKIPISMSYSTEGIKPDNRHGWLGCGWSLNCGGVITRVKHGEADEFISDKIDGITTSTRLVGYYYNCAELDTSEWGSQPFLEARSELHLPEIQDTIYHDLEPDEFVFDFLGYKGSFYLSAKGEWQVRCNAPIKIEQGFIYGTCPFTNGKGLTMLSTKSRIIYKFELTDAEGIKYIFGNAPEAIEYSTSFTKQNDSFWEATSWFLTEMRYPTGESVNFQYRRSNFTCNLWHQARWFNVTSGGATMVSVTPSSELIAQTLTGRLVSPVYLRTITFPLGCVTFDSDSIPFCDNDLNSSKLPSYRAGMSNYDRDYFHLIGRTGSIIDLDPSTSIDLDNAIKTKMSNRRLNAMYVSDNYGHVNHGIFFGYQSPDNNSPRFWLNDLSINNTFNYSFQYSNANLLPEFYSTKIDHWGFFNNRGYQRVSDVATYPQYRRPNAATMYYGILSKIEYPTGGFSQFEFEPHTYSQYLSDNRATLVETNADSIAGGLRIRSICDFDSDSALIRQHSFEYVSTNGRSSGILSNKPKYSASFDSVFVCNTVGKYLANIAVINSIHPIHCVGECNISYSQVSDRFADNSKVVYRFSNFDNSLDEQPLSVIEGVNTDMKLSYRSQDRGLLTQKCEYDSNGYLKIKQDFTYTNGTEEFVPALYFDKNKWLNYDPSMLPNSGCSLNSRWAEASCYKIYTYSPQLASVVTTSYYGTTPFRKASYFTYNKYCQISRIINAISASDSIKTSYSYLWESNPNVENGFALNHITEQRVIDLSSNKTTNQTTATYVLANNGKAILPSQIIQKHRDNTALSDTTNCIYDSKGKLIFVATNGSVGTAYLWGHNRQFIIARIDGITYPELIAIIGSVDEFNSATIPDYSLLVSIQGANARYDMTIARYFPLLGLATVTYPDGTSNEFEYNTESSLLEAIIDNDGNLSDFFLRNYIIK